MHDSRLEDQLRSALRARADALPVTITTPELERRLLLRRRGRDGQRLTLVAAAVAVVAIGSIVALGNGWLRMPAIGVDPGPSPAETPISTHPTTEPTQVAPASPGPRPVPQMGGPNDAIVVRSTVDPLSPVHGIEVQLWPAAGDVSVLATFSGVIGGNPTPDAPARVSQDAMLAVPLVDWEGSGRHIGVAIYDLSEPTLDPRIVTDLGSSGIAWGPDDRLALFDPLAITILEPDTGERASLSIPAGVSVTASGNQDEVWALDGGGFLAWRQDGVVGGPGILRLDGTFVADPSPAISAPLGIERIYDPDGRQLIVGCDSVGDAGSVGCSLIAAAPGGPTEVWYRARAGDGTIADYRWDAIGKAVWLLLDQRSVDGRTLDLILRTGRPDAFVDRATLSDIEIRAETDPQLVGIADDERRVAIALDRGVVALVDTATGDWIAAAGSFAGWADQRGTMRRGTGG